MAKGQIISTPGKYDEGLRGGRWTETKLGVPVLGSSLASFRCSTILVIESMVPFLDCAVSSFLYGFGDFAPGLEGKHAS